MRDPATATSTTGGIHADDARLRRARGVRRASLFVLLALVVAGASGFLGVRTREAAAAGGGYTLVVRFASVARPGLAAPWSIEVRRAGGFTGPVTLRTSSAYLEMFDENGLDPQPSSATATASTVVWEFEPPPGDTLVVSLDARIEPGVQWGRRGSTAVLENGRPVVSVTYRSWVMP